MSNEILRFDGNSKPIEIDLRNAQIYTKCKRYDPRVVSQGFTWHRIIVHHNGQLQYLSDPKKCILQAFFELVDGYEFYPVAYKTGRREDKFLVRQCTKAIDKLFENNLYVKTSSGANIPLTIQFNCATYKFGQISPITLVNKALISALDNLESYKTINGVLNLNNFSERPGFEDVHISLSNKAIFKQICEYIHACEDKFRRVNGLMLRSNDISHLSPLQIFQLDFMLLDLRNNSIKSPARFLRDMENVKAVELLLAENPILKSPKYNECLLHLKSNFQYVDNVPITELNKSKGPQSRDVQMDYHGFRIDSTNKDDIVRFSSSHLWHAIIIPDQNKEYSKELIMDYLFLTISPDLSEFYPCFYKFENGEHRMLVRNCYDQLFHFADVCNFEIKVPQYSPADQSTLSFGALKYFLRMNVASYNENQIDPKQAFSKAITDRFHVSDRILDLENFQDTKGLESIIINMSSKKVLYFILRTASNILLGGCTDLRLGRNKITSMNFPKTFSLLTNLHALDLGNNWIHDLSEISELGVLPLQSLRLDGNPLCQKYELANEYVKSVTKMFPQLMILDGVDLRGKSALTSQKNFLCDTAAYDIVEQFVPEYFKLFESEDRTALMPLYDEKATFTLSFDVKTKDNLQRIIRRLSKYRMHSSNIKSNGNGCYRKIKGITDIIYVFLEWPKIQHDMLSFTTDVVDFSEQEIIIRISGAFMDVAPTVQDLDLKLGFCRTFRLTLQKKNDGLLKSKKRYIIRNDHLDIFSLSKVQEGNAFKYYKFPEENDAKPELTAIDKEHLMIMFQELTFLKSIWCTRCLDDAEWDFEKALQVFVDLTENKEIPENAFL